MATTVWIVSRGEAYEGSDIQGVFWTHKAAYDCVEQIKLENPNRKPWVQEHPDSWKSGCDYLEIDDYIVK